MKEFLKDMYIDIFRDGVTGIILAIILWITSLFVLAILLTGTLYLIDSSFLEESIAKGIITSKRIIPEHTDHGFIMAGKSMIPTTTHYPTSYEIQIRIDNLTDVVLFNENNFNKLKIGQVVNCTYKNGRLFESLYIDEVSW
jgi:hypothetical protein